MAQQEVKIFFKVDGLDDYITDLDDLKAALGNVDAETQAATEATEQLTQATNKVALDTQDRLDALEGGVKILAGSAEFAAGAFGLLGDESNEFFEAAEANVLSVIALAQGAIDVTEGYRILAENTKLAAIAQRIFNSVSKANPYVLLASALIAAAGAVGIYTLATEEDTEATKENYDIKEDLIAAEKELKGLRDEAASRIQEYADLDKANRDIVKADLEKNSELLQNSINLLQSRNSQLLLNTRGIAFMTQAERDQFDATTVRISALEKEIDLNDDILTGIDKIIQARKDEAEATRRLNTVDLEGVEAKETKVIPTQERQFELITGTTTAVAEAEEEVAGFTVDQADRVANFTDVAEETLTNFAGTTTDVFSTLGDLNQLLTKDDEKREKRAFEIQKKASLAQAIIVGALAINKAIASQIIPGDPTSLPRAIAAAAIAAVQTGAQIAVISRQQFQASSPGGNNSPPPPSPGNSITFNPFQGEEQDANITTVGQNDNGGTVRTYVLAGDVTSAQEADQAIQNLATL